MDEPLANEARIDKLPLDQDLFDAELESVNQNLKNSPERIKNLGDEGITNQVRPDLSDRGNKNLECPPSFKRHRSGSKSSNEDESPKTKNNAKLSSVLVRSNRHLQVTDDAKRKALMESQRNDKQVFDRNRRMFGMLMGTLQQFKTEETGRERLTIKRSKIEEKLELAVEKERACVLPEKLDWDVQHRSQGIDAPLDRDESRLDITNRFKIWEHSHRHLCSHIQTDTKPKIFWLPKEHNSITEKKLKETRDYFGLCVAERTAKLRKELDDFDSESGRINEHCQQDSHGNL